MTTFVHLIGPGGAGKTTVGPLLARLLGWVFVDLDAQCTAREGDIARCVQENGCAGDAQRNLGTYAHLRRTITAPTVLALSSGFLTYPADVDPQYPALHHAIEHDPLTALLMPAFELERRVAETVRRQMARPHLAGDRAREEHVIRERFPTLHGPGPRALSQRRGPGADRHGDRGLRARPAQHAADQGLTLVPRHAGTPHVQAFEHALAGCHVPELGTGWCWGLRRSTVRPVRRGAITGARRP